MPLAVHLTDSDSSNEFNMLEDVALNAAAATRTLTLTVPSAAHKLRLAVFLTRTAATNVRITPTGSFDGTNYAEWTSRSTLAGVGTLTDFYDLHAVSGDKDFATEYDVTGLKKVKLVFSGASAGAADLVNVQAYFTFYHAR